MTIVFARGNQRFEIRREASISVGYVNGERSVTGPANHVVARTLIKKHVAGAPEAQVIQLPAKARPGDAPSRHSEPDLAG